MRVVYTPTFKSNFKKFPNTTKNKFAKQIEYLLSDIRHPSLHAKKYSESEGIWQARVNRSIRFYFLIEKDTFTLLDITHHPK